MNKNKLISKESKSEENIMHIKTEQPMQVKEVENTKREMITGIWQKTPIIVAKNGFIYKSLCNFIVNIAVGCAHGCLFCYVVATSMLKMMETLGKLGVMDPDSQWGAYVFLRRWVEKDFLDSLLKAEQTPISPGDEGNRVVMFSSTTDPYPVVPGAAADSETARLLLRRALVLIRDCSTLRVRILTRSPLARQDFDLFKSFGDRLTFGMSLPTLNNRLAKIYEIHAPSPTKRLETLKAAKEAGLNVFVAIAPTYAECDEADIRRTLEAVKALDPITIFHEPINIRAENVNRIKTHAEKEGVTLITNVFDTPNTWRRYALDQLFTVQRLAQELGLINRLKLWPDADLESKSCFMTIRKEEREKKYGKLTLTPEQKKLIQESDDLAYQQHLDWLQGWWIKVSEWPGVPTQPNWIVPQLPEVSPFTVEMPEGLEEAA